ncbi:transport and Golgi organization protein 6 homolog [Venturia canescens]|uniref:transport and Golgi organization protein 6 homolog n=1 Tax=Venturia canescens TaxID=32260 RepID=UPI001C9D082B|nr:transport and Golgi organization protein 6 homolog [Venturia canescens]
MDSIKLTAIPINIFMRATSNMSDDEVLAAATLKLYCVGHVIRTDKSPECRRAAVLVTNLLIQGLGKDVLTDLGHDLVPLYRALKLLRDNDDDHVLRLHAQLALEELDDIVRLLIFSVPKKFDKRIYLPP